MRFHVPGLTHTQTNKEFCGCAFSSKVFKLCRMLTEKGHTVFHYGVEGGNPVCTENVIVASKELQQRCTPANWKETGFSWNGEDELHRTFATNAIAEMKKRVEPNDFFLASWGLGHKELADAVADKCIVVEPGIGYDATFAKFRVFESYTWMNYIYGLQKLGDGAFYDAVIPNYFDPEDFTFREKKEDWFLYVGRIIKRKGIELAIQIAEALKTKIVIAGQGALKNQNEGLDLHSDYMEYVGYADVEKRKDLMSRAKAVIMPTYYIEPFGGVCIEAAISGTPTVTTDWAVFGENVLHGITGYRCRTFEQFCWAAKNAGNISPYMCRKWAMDNFSCERVVGMFEEYFQMLLDLHTEKNGWYAAKPGRTQLDWLNRTYPVIEPEPVVTQSSENNNMIYSRENEPAYALNMSWYNAPKKPGISFIVRARNEVENIGHCLDSFAGLKVPHEINVFLNLCHDDTELEVRKRQAAGMPINVYPYPFLVAKDGFEHFVTPAESIHSSTWFNNFCLQKSNHVFSWEWNSGYEMSPELKSEIEHLPFDRTMPNCSFGNLFSNYLNPVYVKDFNSSTRNFVNKDIKNIELNGKIINHGYSQQDDPLWWSVTNSDSFYIYESPDGVELRDECAGKYEEILEITNCDFRLSEIDRWRQKEEITKELGLPEHEEIIDPNEIYKFTVMLMSRGRPEQLKEAARSLYRSCSNPLNVEFIVRIDRDDDTMHDFSCDVPMKAFCGERGSGVLSDHEVYNTMSKLATGNVFLITRDDAVCVTQNWDTVIAEELSRWPDKIVCMFPDHTNHLNNNFCVFTSKWIEATGHVAAAPFVDAYLSVMARTLNREVRIPVYFVHNHRNIPVDRTSFEGVSSQIYIDASKDVWKLQSNDIRNEDIRALQDYIDGKPIVRKPTSIILPIENTPEYALTLDWYDKPKNPGISFLVRAKNEERTIGICLDSLKQLKIPYEINVILNQCTDNTEEEVKKRKEQGQPINIYHYPFLLAKPGLQHNVTPPNSVHAYSWMINWCLMKGTKKYTFKWDADFIMTYSLADELATLISSDKDICGGSAIYLDTLGDNWEPYLFSNEAYPRYVKYASFESIAFGNDAEDVSYLKKYTFKAKILHDSSLKILKSFWNDPLWWELEPNHPESAKIKERYEMLKEKLGNMSLFSRASCPDADKLYDALCQISPCRDDLVALQDYVYNLYGKTIRKRTLPTQ